MATPSLNPNSIVDLEKGTAARRDMEVPPTKKRTAWEDDDSAAAQTGMALMMLLMYYALVVFYMIGTCEKWWHAALGIGIASVFVLLSVYCMLPRDADLPADSQKETPQPDTITQSDIGTRLLAAHQ
uniref:Uncharacterized protein n=1 Tax=Oryza punctata TaxID=4537 RepID=A0A0E0MHU5_ORYPU